MIKTKKITLESISAFLMALSFILSFNTIYTAVNFQLTYLVSGIFGLVGGLLFVKSHKVILVKKKVIQFLFIVFFITFAFIIIRVRSILGLLILACFYPAILLLLILYDNSQNFVINILTAIVYIGAFISVISLFYWFFGSILSIIHERSWIKITWGNSYFIQKYSILYYVPQYSNLSIGSFTFHARNSAIFAEAPMANAFFCIILLINEFIVRKVPKILNKIFIIAILSTLTTTGWITLIVYIIYKFLKDKAKTPIGKFFKILVCIIGFVASILLILVLVKGKLAQGSGVDRAGMISNEINIFIHSPLIGAGFNKFSNGSSNSLFALLADGGLILTSLFYLPLIGNLLIGLKEDKKLDWFIVIFMVMFLISDIQYTFLTVFIISMYWVLFINHLFCKRKVKVLEKIVTC